MLVGWATNADDGKVCAYLDARGPVEGQEGVGRQEERGQ